MLIREFSSSSTFSRPMTVFSILSVDMMSAMTNSLCWFKDENTVESQASLGGDDSADIRDDKNVSVCGCTFNKLRGVMEK